MLGLTSSSRSEVVIRKCPHDARRISLISTLRAKRPALYKGGECPFCPGREFMTPKANLALIRSGESLKFVSELGGEVSSNWLVRIFPNKYPALINRPEAKPGKRGAFSTYGYHEVLVECREHDEGIYLSDPINVYYALLALKERFRQLMTDEFIEYFIAIKNGGVSSGASVPHPHMQLFALTFTPPEVMSELSTFEEASECPLCSLKDVQNLVIYDSNYFVLAAAPAPRAPFEMFIIPKRHEPSFTYISNEELKDLAEVLRLALLAVRNYLKTDYNLWLHTAPKNVSKYHWHIELLPATTRWGGFEKGTGVYLTTTVPEDAASELRGFISELVSSDTLRAQQ